jgi:lysophospholipase L1-like esterase
LLALIGLVMGMLALPEAAPAHAAPTTYYVSLGDSYSVGYQPGLGSTPGYTVYVAKKTHLRLVNFGCGGATTTSILTTIGCPDPLPHTAGGARYPTSTQIAAAQAFITAHHRHIGLMTVSIGGNDVTSCAAQANPDACVAAAVTRIKTNVATLSSDLRRAAGPKVPLIGLTYPDVILGEYVYPTQPPTAARLALAQVSVTAFKALINPALSRAYATAGGDLLDVTAATGGYTPLSETESLTPYGTIPVAVAKVCQLTWFCAQGNIHATTAGYTLIGKLVVARYHLGRKK